MSLRIIDNCSTDDTPCVVKPYADKGLLLYERNSSNIGLIKNIAKCICTSKAHWVWVFGDDDHILMHSLPYLVDLLSGLPRDTVFARALCAKVSNSGFINFSERWRYSASSKVIRHAPGVNIAQNGSIHSLAFISQLIINPSSWNQDFHDKIYRDTDLYTFVLTLLSECSVKETADLSIHVVAATDRGDRSYYTPNMCIARLTEYTNYERIVHAVLGKNKANKILLNGRKSLLKLRIASCFKLIKNADSYKIDEQNPLAYLRSYRSPYLLDTVVIRFISRAATLPLTRNLIGLIYDTLKKV